MAYKKKEFKYSDDTEGYRKAVEDLGAAPTYSSENTALSKAALDDYMNRAKFSYDVNADARFNQLADKSTKQGQLAMKDTMGQAAAMTGGYGNSYAQSVGQQAYQGYMQQLADKVPELQQIAYNQYQDQGQDMLNKYSLYADAEARGYSRHQEALADYYKQLGIARENLANAEARGWERYVYDENIAYQLDRDAIDDNYRNKQFDESVRQYDATMAHNTEQAALDRAHNKEMAGINFANNKALAELENEYAIADREDKQTHEYTMSGYDTGRKAFENGEFDDWTVGEHEEYALGLVKMGGNTASANQHINMLEEYGLINGTEANALREAVKKQYNMKDWYTEGSKRRTTNGGK